MKIWNWIYRFKIWRDTRGQDMVEYALLAGFIAVAAGATMPPISQSISTVFSKLTSIADQAAAS